jgi:hypothetical protein
MKKMLNEGNQMQNFILCVCEYLCDTIPFSYGSGTVINYGSGSDFLKSYGFVPVSFRFRFHTAQSYGSHVSGSTTMLIGHYL